MDAKVEERLETLRWEIDALGRKALVLAVTLRPFGARGRFDAVANAKSRHFRLMARFHA